MPVALSADSTFEAQLPDDDSVFVCRYLIAKKWREVAHIYDQFGECESAEGGVALLARAIAIGLSDWKVTNNTGRPVTIGDTVYADGDQVPYEEELIEEVLSVREMSLLLGQIVSGGSVSGDDLKNSQ